MPAAPLKECRYPCCLGYATSSGYCAEHTAAATRMPEHLRAATARSNLTSSNKYFRRLRHSFLVRHPLCAGCQTEAATILDHKQPHRGIPLLFWNQRNWQGLCSTCHGKKTAMDLWGRGFWRQKDGRGGP